MTPWFSVVFNRDTNIRFLIYKKYEEKIANVSREVGIYTGEDVENQMTFDW